MILTNVVVSIWIVLSQTHELRGLLAYFGSSGPVVLN